MRANTFWAFAGNATYAACQWIVFVLLMKFLRLSDVGVFAYALAVTGPVFVLANLRLRNLVATGVESSGDFSDYLATRLLTTAAAVASSVLIAFLAFEAWNSFIIVALVACAKACDAVSDICHGLYQRELDMRLAAVGLMTNGILSVTLVALSLAMWPSVAVATGAYAVASALALAAWDLPRSRRLVPVRAAATLLAVRTLIWRALPLGVSSAIGSVQANLPRYAVNAYMGPASLAVFTALTYIPTFGNLVVNATAQAALPVLARDRQSSQTQYRTRLRVLVMAGTVLGAFSVLGTVLIGGPALSWIYGAAYSRHIGVLLLLMTAAGVSYAFLFLGTATTARRRFGAQLGISIASLAVVACSVTPLVSRYGLTGAALALVGGAVVEGAAYALLTMYDFRVDGRPDGLVAGVLVGSAQS